MGRGGRLPRLAEGDGALCGSGSLAADAARRRRYVAEPRGARGDVSGGVDPGGGLSGACAAGGGGWGARNARIAQMLEEHWLACSYFRNRAFDLLGI